MIVGGSFNVYIENQGGQASLIKARSESLRVRVLVAGQRW